MAAWPVVARVFGGLDFCGAARFLGGLPFAARRVSSAGFTTTLCASSTAFAFPASLLGGLCFHNAARHLGRLYFQSTSRLFGFCGPPRILRDFCIRGARRLDGLCFCGSEANGVASIASQTGDIGRGLNEKLYALAYQHHRRTKATPERGDASTEKEQ